MLNKHKVRRGCTVPSPLTWLSTKKSDGTESCEDRFNGWLQRSAGDPDCRDTSARGYQMDLSMGVPFPPTGVNGERQELGNKLPLGAPLLTCPRDFLLKSFPQRDTSARLLAFEIRVFLILGELPKVIEPDFPYYNNMLI